MSYVKTEYDFNDKHPPNNLYPHVVTFRVIFDSAPDIETVRVVIRGHQLLNTKVGEARAWLEANVRDWQPESTSASVFRFCFAKKHDAMLFRMVHA